MRQQRCSNSGYVLVLTSILLGVFLSLAAAAIDLGNLYLWKLRLDKATRAGVLSGLGYRAVQGWQNIYGAAPAYSNGNPVRRGRADSTGIANLLAETHSVIQDNLRASFPPGTSSDNLAGALRRLYPLGSDGQIRADLPDDAYNPITDAISVTYAYDVPTFFVGRISNAFGFSVACPQSSTSGTCRVESSQSASLDYATVLLLLDLSGSMNCEIGDTTCACRVTDTCGNNNKRKIIDILRGSQSAALETFYQRFNPFRDRISIIPFNLAAQVAFGFSQQRDATTGSYAFGLTNATFSSFQSAINNLQPLSNTNPCDALIHAIGELDTLTATLGVQSTALRPFIVLFSDGAPNAMRAEFTGPMATAFSPSRTNDWYHFSLEWIDTSSPSPSAYDGPSPLIHASQNLFNKVPTADETTLYLSTADSGSQPVRADPNEMCGDVWWNSTNGYFLRALNGVGLLSIPSGKKPGCLFDLGFRIPVTGNPRQVQGVNFENYNQLPYYCSIEAADIIRSRFGGTVFTIGLGNPSSECPSDPLQDSSNDYVRKDNFLARVAVAPDTLQSNGTFKERYRFVPQKIISGCGGTPRTVGYSLTNGSEQTSPNGEYYATNNPNDLPDLFVQIAKQILLRLNS